MNQILSDFFEVGKLRLSARGLMALRGLMIITSLSPYALGEYTIWLLYYFYFSMLDFGVQHALERDVPHFQGEKNFKKSQEAENIGWSSFFILTGLASFLLIIISFILMKDLTLAVLVGAYLFFDRIFRSYEVNSRIQFRYRDNEIAQNISAISSFIIIFFLIPLLGVPGIFFGFIMSSILGTIYLRRKTPLQFRWFFNMKRMLNCVKHAIPLSGFIYSLQFFHSIALTVLALQWDKETLGYFAFAFRIFQIFVALFPSLAQDVFRTRLYFKIAQTQNMQEPLRYIAFPLVSYCCVTSLFWLFLYWWSDWLVFRVAPLYMDSVIAIKLLTLALLPLGVSMVFSDYLCSRALNRVRLVVLSWFLGIVAQASWVYWAELTPANIMHKVPLIYLASTLIVYVLIIGESLQFQDQVLRKFVRIFYLFLPLGFVSTAIYFVQSIFHMRPSPQFVNNISPFLFSFTFSGVVILILFFMAQQKGKEVANKA